MKKILILFLLASFLCSCAGINEIKEYRIKNQEEFNSVDYGVITQLPEMDTEGLATSLLLTYYLMNYEKYSYSMPTSFFSSNYYLNYFDANVISDDGEYLGKITYSVNPDSILNSIGIYGSELSGKSIWNRLGKYGSKFSPFSAFNPYATSPPKIYKNGIFVGYLTINSLLPNRVNPYVFK